MNANDQTPTSTKEQVLEVLKENLTIDIQQYRDFDRQVIEISIKFDGKQVCNQSFSIKSNQYY